MGWQSHHPLLITSSTITESTVKVYSLPEKLEATIPEFDIKTTYTDWENAEREHREQVKQWLVDNGYTGKNTGRILYMPMADSHAEYMFAEGSKSCLIHLPYGDAWHSPDVQYLPKKEILRRLKN
jgi:hypothetical protein